MLRFLTGTFIILHGLVHLWYATLSRKLVAFEAEMGWSGESWAFTEWIGDPITRSLASVLYTLVTAGFVVSGIGIFLQGSWWHPLMIGSAILSSISILIFWDGKYNLLVQKGLLGLIINIIILIALYTFSSPT